MEFRGNDGLAKWRSTKTLLFSTQQMIIIFGSKHRLIKYSLDNLCPIRTAEAFEAVDWLHQQTWLYCGIA